MTDTDTETDPRQRPAQLGLSQDAIRVAWGGWCDVSVHRARHNALLALPLHEIHIGPVESWARVRCAAGVDAEVAARWLAGVLEDLDDHPAGPTVQTGAVEWEVIREWQQEYD